MARVYTQGLNGKKQSFIRSYGDFLGLHLAGDPSAVSAREFAYLENMYADYDNPTGASVETVPGYRLLYRFGEEIHGLFRYPVNGQMQIAVHAGTSLYAFPADTRDELSALTPVGSGLKAAKSSAFLFCDSFYLLDGQNFFRLSADGEFSSVTRDAYIPVTYLNSLPYEARNLLSSTAIERHIIGEPDDYRGATPGLRYYENEDGVSCTVAGMEGDTAPVLVIPEAVRLNGKELTVTAIADDAFTYYGFTDIHLPSTLTHIGARAFEWCKNLRAVVLPDSVTTLGEASFSFCEGLHYFHLGTGIQMLDRYALGSCPALQRITYPLDDTRFSAIESRSFTQDDPATLSFFYEAGIVALEAKAEYTPRGGSYYFPIAEDFNRLSTVVLDGQVIKAGKNDFFPIKAENYIPPAVVYEGVESDSYFLFMTLVPQSDGTFTVSGSADGTDELTLGSFSVPRGEYLLRGMPKGKSGAALSVSYRLPDDETVYRFSDTGSGVRLSVPTDGVTVTLSFSVEGGTPFENTVIFPELVKSECVVSYAPTREFDGTQTRIKGVYLQASNEEVLPLLTLDIYGVFGEPAKDERATEEHHAGKDAILGCRLSAVYDGRIFLSGNPKFPNSVFYSSRTKSGEIEPSYFGEFNYFRDGSGRLENKTIFATPSGLCVIKEGNGEESRVFFHTGCDTEDDLCPRIYPAVSGAANAAATGEGLSFFGMPIYLSENGLCSITRASIAGEREPTVQSRAVNRAITGRDHTHFDTEIWKNYLLLSLGDGEILMLDANRESGGQHAFYRLSGIGSYTGDTEGYEYARSLPIGGEGLTLSKNGGLPAVGEVGFQNGIPYVTQDGISYACVYRGERVGGVFSPARRLLSADELLYFATESGDLCVFNTDMRAEDGKIPSAYYSFMGHRYPSGVALRMDDCGMPYLTKNTLRHSTVVRLSDFAGGRVHVCLRTDKRPYTEVDCLCGGDADFCETDFGNFHFDNDRSSLFSIRDRERRYAEKQYYLYTDDFKCRFGISELVFRFTIGGRIKR